MKYQHMPIYKRKRIKRQKKPAKKQHRRMKKYTYIYTTQEQICNALYESK